MKRRIPNAVANYEEIVRDHYYFVDKIRFIHEIEQYKIPVFLRPRRFGKSLWCSILECYYDINRKDRFEELFGNTDIGRNPTASRNRHLVMRFDFSQVEVKPDIAFIERSFNHVARSVIGVFASAYGHIGDFSSSEQQMTASDALIPVLAQVRRGALPPVNIIIDEYDNFTNQILTTHQDSLYQELTTGDSFLRTFFKVIKAGVGDDLRIHYNGYRLLPDAPETLYNSTICNFHLNDLLIGEGRIPAEMIDHNLRTDINWLRRLCGSDKETRELVRTLMLDGALPVDTAMLGSKFNMRRFVEKPFFPLSLYYLGMVTFRDRFSLEFPNLTVKKIFTEYFNEFKHYPKEKAARLGVMDWTEPPAEALGQVNAYAADLLRRYPDLRITRHVACTISSAEFRFFALDGPHRHP